VDVDTFLTEKHIVPGTILRWEDEEKPLVLILNVRVKEPGNWVMTCFSFEAKDKISMNIWREDFYAYRVFAEAE
jgi:uncharacterized protein YdeI (YjbR/CyaY-like superfamily)